MYYIPRKLDWLEKRKNAVLAIQGPATSWFLVGDLI